MTLSYDLYWSFRSPYSYMVTPRLVELERDFDVACNVRPVYPLAVRTPAFFEQQDPLWIRYFMVDVFREAAFRGLPFRWPRPDPVQQSPEEGYRMKQPYIHRLTHLGVAAAQRGRGLAFLDEVSRTIWGGGTDNWHEGDHLARAAERAGLVRRRRREEPGRPARRRPLGGADDDLRRGALLRPGPLRPTQVAHGGLGTTAPRLG